MQKIMAVTVIVLLLSAAVIWLMYGQWAEVYFENILEEGQKEVEDEVAHIMAESMNDRLNEEELFIYETDGDGILVFKVNSRFINALISNLNDNLDKYMESTKEMLVHEDFGLLIENHFISKLNVITEIKSEILSVEDVRCWTEYKKEEDHNRYSIYCSVIVKARIKAPLFYEVVEMERKALLQEAVICSDMPESCLLIPGEDLLEVS